MSSCSFHSVGHRHVFHIEVQSLCIAFRALFPHAFNNYADLQSAASSGSREAAAEENGQCLTRTINSAACKQNCYQTLLGYCEEAGRRHSHWTLAIEVVTPLASEWKDWSKKRTCHIKSSKGEG
ncbi:hypothetical protein PoB_002708800 [Plakobranchus ocellatus]|uniref:Uncharacterized protein n=1 Tax=Plakobranchus ocellatus TaxID=259542 RepID=A0AAV4A1U0_9GAST|nr:hypothetical protein PoB_002708800 [Plakobranchus ocellatus]